MTDRKTLLKQIENAGIKHDDTVMIHISLKALGEVEGRAEGFIDTFREYLSDGLLLIPTHTWASVHRSATVFDVRSTVPCLGTLPTIAAFHKDAVRSLHPTHSIAAFGKRAQEYVKNEETCRTPTPTHGCWGRLYDENAKILLVGVSHGRNTFIHAVDEMVDVPNRLSQDEVPFTVIDKDGNEIAVPAKTHWGINSDYFTKFTHLLESEGATENTKIGLADTIVCDAKKLADTLIPILSAAKEKGVNVCADDKSLYKIFFGK